MFDGCQKEGIACLLSLPTLMRWSAEISTEKFHYSIDEGVFSIRNDFHWKDYCQAFNITTLRTVREIIGRCPSNPSELCVAGITKIEEMNRENRLQLFRQMGPDPVPNKQSD